MIRLGVLGWPVAHSRSPAMHNAALADLGLRDWSYQKLPVPPELFDETVRGLEAAGFVGANVTIPHKEAALALADSATDAARAIGAANTLSFAEGRIHADNTDAPGLIEALGGGVEGQTALVLGAGGSARGAVYALLGAGAARVAVCNRSRDRAERVAADLGAEVVDVPERADILVNCTSVGLHDDALPLAADLLAGFGTVCDLVYRAGGTALLRAAAQAGADTVDGLEVLVAQGALSLESWCGQPAPRGVMRAAAYSDQV